MKVLIFIFLFNLLTSVPGYSQNDILYTVSGNKIQAKVSEINTTDIKYKDATNLDGPTYVISKRDIVLIQFPNGSAEIINSDAPALIPKKSSPVNPKNIGKKQSINLDSLHRNTLSINAASLTNGDLTLFYERRFPGKKHELFFLAGYSFNSEMGASAKALLFVNHAKKNFELGTGINFFSNKPRRTKYFRGIWFKYMSYNYDKEINIGNNQLTYETKQGQQLAFMISRGLVYNISPDFSFKLFGSYGIAFTSSASSTIVPKFYIGYCFGYKFN